MLARESCKMHTHHLKNQVKSSKRSRPVQINVRKMYLVEIICDFIDYTLGSFKLVPSIK